MQTLDEIAACVAGYDPNALPVAQAQEFIARLVPRVQAVESLALRSALGRVLARDIVSPIHVPAHDNSAMDGYALRAADLAASGDTLIGVAGTAFAGEQFRGAVGPGQGVRIMTGAVMPAGLDTVVPQEFTRAGPDGRICIPPGTVAAGDNRRLAGEDLARGEVALAAGRIITPADLGLMASLGRPRCRCSAACAWPSSPPATNCAPSASRWTRAVSTTATATRCGACCSAWVST
jgi:molybdopterin molybdotransferase